VLAQRPRDLLGMSARPNHQVPHAVSLPRAGRVRLERERRAREARRVSDL
jgi:hypothetical protein